MGDLILQESETSSDSYLFFIHIIMYTKNDSLYTDHTNTLRFFCI